MAGGKPAQHHTVRIIGGRWRGRKLAFADSPGLRPTPDRVRETLFNWLAGDVSGAHCLDLFAGSGALGLEALSRGAASCVFIDSIGANCSAIATHLNTLQASAGECLTITAADWLQRPPPRQFDIVFLDPPFGKQLLDSSCAALEAGNWLAADAMIYLESGQREPAPQLPQNWSLHRDKQAGEVRYQLFVRNGQFE